MRFIRNARFRERCLEYFSKALLIAISALACLWMVSGAHATPASITGIKSQAIDEGTYSIDFSFSQRVPAEDVMVEFERNFVQISLKNVSAYPARTENINQAPLQKVFTYQYQPDLARARVLLKGQASSVRNKTSWEITPQGLRLTVRGVKVHGATAQAADSVKSKAAAVTLPPTQAPAPIAAAAPAAAAATFTSTADSEDERIVQEILNEVKPKVAKSDGEHTPLVPKAATLPASAASEDQPIFAPKHSAVDGVNTKQESAATRIFASLLLVIGIIGVGAVTYRRFAMGKGGAIFQRQPKVIEIVANQAVGPKRSIALVKVMDLYFVVGMSGDGMTLISALGSDVKFDRFLDNVGGPGASFNDTFESALLGNVNPVKNDNAGGISHRTAMDTGIRSMIKKRIEGFKPL